MKLRRPRHRLPIAPAAAAPPESPAGRRFCAKPFQHLEIVPDGRAYLCCPAWLPTSVGNIQTQPVSELWDGPQAQAVRRSILDGSFSHCTACPFLKTVSGPVHYVDAVRDGAERAILRSGAVTGGRVRWLNLAYDQSCNLSCPSCRTGLVVATREVQDRLQVMQDRLIDQGFLGSIDWLYVTGSGDPFASRLFRDLLRGIQPADFPRLRIMLHTNGLLFTPGAWTDLGPVRSLVQEVEVSIDAASPATYALNRRGGDWNTLLTRLDFISGLRARGPVKHLRLSFVVQSNNWREMPAFVQLAQGYGADRISFAALRNWGTFSDEEYSRRAVHRASHPEHAAFRAWLADWRLQGPRVKLNDLRDDPA